MAAIRFENYQHVFKKCPVVRHSLIEFRTFIVLDGAVCSVKHRRHNDERDVSVKYNTVPTYSGKELFAHFISVIH